MRSNRTLLLNLDVALAIKVVIVASAVVIGLGLFREWYVATAGTDTIVEGLRQIAFDTENCLAAWYSSLQMMLAATLLAVVGQTASMREWRPYWRFLALVFVCFSLDETASFHEAAIEPLREMLGVGGFFYFAWIIPGAIACLALGLIYLPFVLALPSTLRNAVIAAGGMYLGGAIGMEAIGGYAMSTFGATSLYYIAAFSLEESLEIAGIVVFIVALMLHLARDHDTVAVALRTPRATAIPAPAEVGSGIARK